MMHASKSVVLMMEKHVRCNDDGNVRHDDGKIRHDGKKPPLIKVCAILSAN